MSKMLTQTQCSERLSLLEQRWEIVHNGLGDVLDRTQEARRWRLEHRIGWAIVVLILLDLDLALSLWPCKRTGHSEATKSRVI